MLAFTTTEPGFLGSAGSELFVPCRNPEVKGKWRGVYMHGKVERIVGYDIPKIIDGLMEYKPEQDCVVEIPGETIECILVAWPARCGTYPDPDAEIFKGLICAKTDAESLAYARKCSIEKVTSL